MKLKIFLITVFIISSFFRLYRLGNLPDSYSPDELAQGYTAYSILNTGADEWGSQNLLSLKSFGDYKLPLQTWLMVPSVRIFGLTPFAVRLPNVLISILTTISIFFLSKKLFPKSKSIAVLTFVIFSLSPWSISMSRIALEANLAVNLIIIGLTLFYYNRYILSAIFFGLSLYTYHSAKVFLPLFLPLISYLNLNKKIIYFLLSIFVVLLPLLLFTSQNSRTSDIAIFNPTDKWASVSDTRYTFNRNGLPDTLSRLFQNKAIYTFQKLSQNYLSYFSPQFLITHGAGETTYGMIPGFGVIGIIGTLGLIIFFIQLFRKDLKLNPTIITLVAGLCLSPLPAALAKGNYAANRASIMMPFLIIISAIGLSYLKKIPLLIVSTLLVIEGLFFATTYFYSANQVLSEGMLYGHQQANQYIRDLKPDKVIYSRKLSEPQAYYMFFQNTDPTLTQKESGKWNQFQTQHLSFLDQLGEYNLDKAVFKEISLPSDLDTPNTLIIGRPNEFLDLKPTHIIYYPYYTQMKPAIYLYLTK